MKHGKGKYLYITSCVYDGDWILDNKNGYGTYRYLKTNEEYKGEWSNGQKNGKGTFTYSNGDKFIGEFVDGKKQGEGIFHYVDNTILKC